MTWRYRMNIGFDAKRAFHNASGLGNYSRFIVRILAQHFPNSKYFLFNPKAGSDWDIADIPSTQEVLPKNNNWTSYWRSFNGNKKVTNFNLNVYHGLSNELPFGLEKSKAKKIVTIHDLIFKRFPALYNTPDRIIYNKKFKHAVEVADTIIAISETTKKDIVEFYNISPNKITVVYQGCNPLFYNQSSKEQKDKTLKKYGLPKEFMICVGTVEERKNGVQIIEAMSSSKIDIPIVFVGKETKYQNKIIQKSNQYQNLSSKVFFVKNASNEEVRDLYQSALVSLYPSIFEGFGIPVLESIASGTPVITNSSGCFREAGGDAALYFDINDSYEFGKKIDLVCNNEQIRSDLKSARITQLKKFNEKFIANQIMEIYSS